MIEKIIPRADPTNPSATPKNIRDPRVSKFGKSMHDLSAFKGIPLRLTVMGVVQATNIKRQNVTALIRHGVFGTDVLTPHDELEHDPAHTRADLFLDWAARQPKPLCLEDFEEIRNVRALLHVSAKTPHPDHFIVGAYEFLDAYDLATVPELRKLLHVHQSRTDPTRQTFISLSDRTSRSSARKASLASLARHLPACVEKMPGTSLAPDMSEILASPSESVCGRLTSMGPLRTCATIFVLRLAARVVSENYISRVVTYLCAINDELELATSTSSPEQAAAVALKDIMERAKGDQSREARRATEMLMAWASMANDLEIAAAKENQSVKDELTWTGRVMKAEINKFQNSVLRKGRLSKGERRLATASSLADNLLSITAALDLRQREVEQLHQSCRAAAQRIGADTTLSSVPIIHEWHETGPDGHPTGRLTRHHFRLWRTTKLLDELAAPISPTARQPSVLARAKREIYPAEHSITILEYEGAHGEAPWFVDFYAADLMGGSLSLNLSIRKRRYELLSKLSLVSGEYLPPGLLDFRVSDGAIFRTALNLGRTLIPINELGLGIQAAHTIFNIGLVTAARAGEILQIRMDGSNVHHHSESDLAFWEAEPKQPGDRADPTPIKRSYYLDDRVLAQLVTLRDEMRGLLGQEAWTPVPPCAALKKLDPAPWLFRTRTQMMDAGNLKTLLRYFAAGIAVFGVHDIRAAVAKYRLDQGDSLEEIANLLGHSSRGQTKGYARPTKQMSDRKQTDRREWTAEERRLQRLDKIRSRAA